MKKKMLLFLGLLSFAALFVVNVALVHENNAEITLRIISKVNQAEADEPVGPSQGCTAASDPDDNWGVCVQVTSQENWYECRSCSSNPNCNGQKQIPTS